MRVIHEITLAIFSLLILIACAIYTLVLFGVVDVNLISQAHDIVINNSSITNIMIAVNIVLMIFALIGIFGDSSKENKIGNGIVVKNEKGNLLISIETLRNLIVNSVRKFEGVEINSTNVEVTPESRLKINVVISVSENIVIKELTDNLQSKIKEVIKKSSDMDVQLVNISVKGILKQKAEKQEKPEAVAKTDKTKEIDNKAKAEKTNTVAKETKVEKEKIEKVEEQAKTDSSEGDSK
ncbi:MAG: alkaline shock response membrane anchor protein AmaP [Oscillospiraceae bacterium]|nr:alkaline shock response membrane anchor protein AmaP [Oscillospiraceae bacterium]